MCVRSRGFRVERRGAAAANHGPNRGGASRPSCRRGRAPAVHPCGPLVRRPHRPAVPAAVSPGRGRSRAARSGVSRKTGCRRQQLTRRWSAAASSCAGTRVTRRGCALRTSWRPLPRPARSAARGWRPSSPAAVHSSESTRKSWRLRRSCRPTCVRSHNGSGGRRSSSRRWAAKSNRSARARRRCPWTRSSATCRWWSFRARRTPMPASWRDRSGSPPARAADATSSPGGAAHWIPLDRPDVVVAAVREVMAG